MKLLVDMNLSPRWIAWLAEAELRTLRQANPNAEAVRRWLSQVQAMRR